MRRWLTGKALTAVLLLIVSFVTLEVALRAYLAYKVGPSTLLYGLGFERIQLLTPSEAAQQEAQSKMHSVMFHENAVANYSKYFPHQLRYDHDENGNVFTVGINSSGFRGKEFDQEKKTGVIRVVTLGASSTFGYGDRDNETYPHYLEEFLNGRCRNRSVEVINLGIPHLTGDNIYSLFIAEALPLKPDVVTFYEGVNDSERVQDSAAMRAVLKMVRDHLVLVEFVASLRERTAREFSDQDFRRHLEGKVEHFLTNLARLQQESQKRDIVFIVASQQTKSLMVRRQQIKGITYDQEAHMVRAKLREGKKLTANELYFLTHSALMDAERDWAAMNRVPFVDVIRALDQDRDVLVSWVHLTPKGNRMIAAALAEEIQNHTCLHPNPSSLVKASEDQRQ
jgi:lysophospholipase L1-like esterase